MNLRFNTSLAEGYKSASQIARILTENWMAENGLAQAAQQASEQSQGVLISNHDTEFTRSIYREARLKTVMVQRNIAAKGSSRQRVGELLAIYGK